MCRIEVYEPLPRGGVAEEGARRPSSDGIEGDPAACKRSGRVGKSEPGRLTPGHVHVGLSHGPPKLQGLTGRVRAECRPGAVFGEEVGAVGPNVRRPMGMAIGKAVLIGKGVAVDVDRESFGISCIESQVIEASG